MKQLTLAMMRQAGYHVAADAAELAWREPRVRGERDRFDPDTMFHAWVLYGRSRHHSSRCWRLLPIEVLAP